MLNPAYGPFVKVKVCAMVPTATSLTARPSTAIVPFTVPQTWAYCESTEDAPVSKSSSVTSTIVSAGIVKFAGTKNSVPAFGFTKIERLRKSRAGTPETSGADGQFAEFCAGNAIPMRGNIQPLTRSPTRLAETTKR